MEEICQVMNLNLPEKDHLSVILEKSLKSEGYEIQVFNGSVSMLVTLL